MAAVVKPSVKNRVGITVVGKDREGVVAAFTKFIFIKGGNIEAIHQNVVQGLFGMYIEASFREMNRVQFDESLRQLGIDEYMDVNIYHATSSHKNIAVFVTREAHCLEALLEAASDGRLKGRISVVLGTEGTLRERTEAAGIPFVLVDERNQEKAEASLLEACGRYEIGLIVLARYMRILTPNFVWRYPRRIINIHPSLLPAFPGAYAYMQAFERGTKIIGVTSHYVTESLDQGPIILQKSFPVDAGDTLEGIKSAGQKLEAETLTEAVRMHLEGRLQVRWRKVHIRPE